MLADYRARRIGVVIVLVLGLFLQGRSAFSQALQFEQLKTFVYPSVDPSGNPAGRMVQAADGFVYGLTSGLYTNLCASAYRFDPQAPATTFATLWTGSAGNCRVGSAEGIDGAIGDGGLVKAGDGNMYFALPEGGANGDTHGAIFRITAGSGVVEPFYYFAASPTHALTLYGPQSGLAVGPDGALYGATMYGRSSGDTGDGGVGGWFRLTTDGTFTALVDMPSVPCGPVPTDFCKSADGYYLNPLTVGSDGNIYGTLVNADTQPSFLYKVYPGPGYMVPLHTFAHDGGLKGQRPVGALVEVPPALGQIIGFVGVTRGAGSLFPQSIYYVDVNGGTANVAPLFSGPVFGDHPRAGLVLDPSNGALYGTTYGATGGISTVFQITAGFRIDVDPVLTVVYRRLSDVNFQPFAPVLVGADGHLYGSSFGLGAGDPGGFLFRLRASGKVAQAPLNITGAPDAAVYQETFTVDTTGGSGTGAVTFAASGACTNSGSGALITMISGTGTCAISATKAGDDDYDDALASDSVNAAQAPQQALGITGAPASAAIGTSFTVGSTGGTGTGALTFSATGACSNTDGGPVMTMTASTGTCAIAVTKAADDNYLSATSPIVPVPATAAAAPAAPTSTAAVANSSAQITVTWTDNAGNEDGFVIERSTTNGSNFAPIATLAANVTTFVNNTGLTPSTKYLYRVLAFNSGGVSPYSSTAIATTLNPPPAPTGLKATTVSKNQINLTWISKGTQATGFKVSRSQDGTTFSVVATLGLVTTYLDLAPVPTTYYYQVQAFNANGDSPPSNTASASTVQTLPLAPTSLKAMSPSSSSITLTWTNTASIVVSITIERSADGTTFTGIGSAPGSATSYADSGLAAGTTYFYRVRATNIAGVSPYSNTASTRTKVK